MERYFKYGDDIGITISRTADRVLELSITSDYRFSLRKSKIGFNKEHITEIQNKFKDCWKSVKTKKLKSAIFYFDELDWYDDLVDVYETPVFKMIRGKKIPKVTYREHGSIPKDWGVVLRFTIEDTKKITPIMEVIDKFFRANFNKQERKSLEKKMREVVSGDADFAYFSIP